MTVPVCAYGLCSRVPVYEAGGLRFCEACALHVIRVLGSQLHPRDARTDPRPEDHVSVKTGEGILTRVVLSTTPTHVTYLDHDGRERTCKRKTWEAWYRTRHAALTRRAP